MVKLAETNQLVCHFRFDSHQTITQLTQDSRVDDLQQIHTGIMLSTRLLNDVNQPEEALRKKGHDHDQRIMFRKRGIFSWQWN